MIRAGHSRHIKITDGKTQKVPERYLNPFGTVVMYGISANRFYNLYAHTESVDNAVKHGYARINKAILNP